MKAKIVFKYTDGSTHEDEKLISFTFVKEAYTPYTSLTARIHADDLHFENISDVYFYVGDKLVHHGLVDRVDSSLAQSGCNAYIFSRGFTSLLCQNQLEPGMISQISINSLMDSYYTLPNVTHEDNSDTSGYIYVKYGSTMWDGVANLAYKQTGMYPYIRGTNCVRITAETAPVAFEYSDEQLTERGTACDYRRLISDLNMSDINGEHGTYTLSDTAVTSRNIVRHKVFELDYQYLYDPQQALEYRSKFAKRGFTSQYCSYCGYNGEDLCDIVSFGDVSGRRICRVEISGDSSGVFTSLSVYDDGFFGS